MASDRLSSNLVNWLKLLLPLAALGILSSVVFFARGTEEVRQIPFVTVEGEEFERERVSNAVYHSVTGDGAALQITAREVVPAPGERDVFLADAITGRLETSNRIIQATAPDGMMNVGDDLADLTGIVSIDTSDGFHVLTENLHARLDVTFVESGGPVWGEAPFGRIEAGRMRLGEPGARSDLLRFTDGVKVIYEPRN